MRKPWDNGGPVPNQLDQINQFQVLTKKEVRLEEELKLASLVQKDLLPRHPPEIANLEFATFYKSDSETGGDSRLSHKK